ncbi:MAG TPA: hypothetical protein VGG08_05875 [Solirubrobacteraceae bacterium]|jgi:hypothetical protein
MSITRDEAGGGSGHPAPPVSVALAGAAPTPPAQPEGAETPGRSALRRRRDELAEQVAELHWDLGGLAYEMAIRDHFRLDVLVRRAALLQERDGELAEVERLLRMEEEAVAGSCGSCGAPHSRGALYCWQCGTTLMERLPSSDGADTQSPEEGLRELLAAASENPLDRE